MSKINLLIAFLVLCVVGSLSANYTTPKLVTAPEATSDGRVHATVVFSGDAGEEPITHDFFASSLNDLKVQVSTFLASLNQAKADVATGGKAGDVITAPPVVSPPVQPPPTQEQIYFDKLAQFYGVDQAVKAGIVPVDDVAYLALKKELTTDFQSAFVGVSGWPR